MTVVAICCCIATKITSGISVEQTGAIAALKTSSEFSPMSTLSATWREPLNSDIYRHCKEFSLRTDSALSHTPSQTVSTSLNSPRELVKSVLSALATFSMICSYCVCGLGGEDDETAAVKSTQTELMFLTGATGLVSLGQRLLSHIHTARPTQNIKTLYNDLNDGLFTCRRILLVQQMHGMDALKAMDIRIAKRLLMDWYTATLCLREATELMFSSSTLQVNDQRPRANTVTPLIRGENTTPVSPQVMKHRRNISGFSNSASSSTSSNVSMSPPQMNSAQLNSNPSEALLSMADQSVNTAINVLNELDNLIKSQPISNEHVFKDIIQCHGETMVVCQTFLDHLQALKTSPPTALQYRSFWTDSNTLIAQIAKLGSSSKILVKNKVLSRTVAGGLQTLTRMTRNFAVHLTGATTVPGTISNSLRSNNNRNA